MSFGAWYCCVLLYLAVRRYENARGWLVADVAGFGRVVCHAAMMPDILERDL